MDILISKTVVIALKIAVILTVLFSAPPLVAEPVEPRIGVIAPLSGGMVTIGTAVKNGIELARREHPEVFQEIQFSYEDDRFDAEQSLSAYRNLKSNFRPSVILGFGTVLAHTVGPALEKDGVPLINFNFEAGPAIGRPLIVRSMNHTNQYMGALAEHLLRSGDSELQIVRAEATFFQAMVESLRGSLGERRTLREVATVDPGETDFRSLIAKLRAKDHAQVGVFLWPEQLLAFFRQAREMRLDAEFFGTDLCETAATLAPDGTLLEGCLYPDNEVSSEFRARYRAAFGDEAQLTFAGSAYDMTLLVGEVYRQKKPENSREFLSALSYVKDRAGVLGTYSFQESSDVGKYFEYPVYVKRISGKRGVPVVTRRSSE